MAKIKKPQAIACVVRMWTKGNIPLLLVGVHTYTILEINLTVSQEIENILREDPAIPLLGIYPKDAAPYHKNMCSTIFIQLYL